jgi:hypothetical protein
MGTIFFRQEFLTLVLCKNSGTTICITCTILRKIECNKFVCNKCVLVLVQIDLIQIQVQLVLDQIVLNLIQICYIQIRYIQFCVRIGQFHTKLDT